MRYTTLVQQVLAICIAGIAVKASAVTYGPSHAHAIHQSRHWHADFAKRAGAEGHIQPLFNRSAGSRWTFYDAQTGQAGSCGDFIANTDFSVAMNGPQINPELCFKTIKLTFGGKSTTARIMDTCPSCPPNALDLTQHLFAFFLGRTPSFEEGGVLQGEWEFTSDSAPAPAPPPPPPPPPTKKVLPTSTTTKKPLISSTHIPSSSSNMTAISTGTASASKTTSINYFSGPASGLAVPTGTISINADTSAGVNGPGSVGNLQLLNQVIVGLGGLAVAARNV